MSEEQILQVIVQELWLGYRIEMYRINCPVGGKVRPNTRGIPDLIGYVPKVTDGNFNAWVKRPCLPFFIEVKKPGGRRRPDQVVFIEKAKAGGCIALFAESWADVERELKAAGVYRV